MKELGISDAGESKSFILLRTNKICKHTCQPIPIVKMRVFLFKRGRLEKERKLDIKKRDHLLSKHYLFSVKLKI